jgi:hypothetical protein
VRKHHRLNWERERGTGTVKCLGPTENRMSAMRDRDICRRRARRGLGTLGCVDTSTLHNGEAAEHNALVAQMGTLVQFSRRTVTNILAARQQPKLPSRSELLSVFTKS